MTTTQRYYETVTPEDGAGIDVVNAFGGDLGRCLHRQVAPLRAASPHLADLDDRITAHLTRSARDHPDETVR